MNTPETTSPSIDIDILATAGLLARDDRDADGEGRGEPTAGEIGDEVYGDGRGLPGPSRDAECATDGSNHGSTASRAVA